MLVCNLKVMDELKLMESGLAAVEVENARAIEDQLLRAYQIHRQRGGYLGYDLEDWLEAERELAGERNSLSPSMSKTVKANVSY